MMMWAEFLRREAKEFACDVLETSHLSLERCMERVCGYLTPADRRSSSFDRYR
jgi:hypothetical protein